MYYFSVYEPRRLLPSEAVVAELVRVGTGRLQPQLGLSPLLLKEELAAHVVHAQVLGGREVNGQIAR